MPYFRDFCTNFQYQPPALSLQCIEVSQTSSESEDVEEHMSAKKSEEQRGAGGCRLHVEAEDVLEIRKAVIAAEAEVVAVFGHNIRLQFEGGLQSRMSIGDYWDQWPFCRRADRTGFRVPNRIEVSVRRIDPGRRFLNVSMHGYPQDGKYCNSAAGYRSTYDARQGMFRLLPWERSRKMLPR